MDEALLAKFINETKIVLRPKRLLAGYGPTNINYHLISPIDELKNKTRLRVGSVVSQRPIILTQEALKERFEGFGEESQEMADWLYDQYRDVLRALEYKFRNKDYQARVLQDNPLTVSGRVQEDLRLRCVPDAVVIRCPDAAWSLALMKFTLDETARSFPSHVRSYEEHGLFDPGSTIERRRQHEIDKLFGDAASNPETRAVLGHKLKEYGLFERYQDRFLSLFR
jgi:hypothetical protein